MIRTPKVGSSLGKDYYKIRMKITGKNAGESGGARVIIDVKVINAKVYILSIYDKSDKDSLDESELDKLLGNI